MNGISSDPPAIHLAAVSDDFHWLACSDFAKTVNIFSLRKMKVCEPGRGLVLLWPLPLYDVYYT